jgi:ATP-dependent DNA helicase RecQ
MDGEIQIRLKDNRYELMSPQGSLVGRLAKAFSPPKDSTFVSAHVIAIVERSQDSIGAEFQSWFKCDKWEVILPELVYTKDISN